MARLAVSLAALSAAAVLCATHQSAVAQPINGGFETPLFGDPTQPQGWDDFNGAVRRVVGDGLLPALLSSHSGDAVIELTPRPVGPSDFVGFSSNQLLDPDNPLSGKNNVAYTFNPPNGPDVVARAWAMIPASEPVVRHRAGLKFEFRRTADDSTYEGFDFFLIDPASPNSQPGLVGVTTPTGPGVHTNGQWIQLTATFHQSQFRDPLWPLPPVNPDAKVTVLALRYGDPYVAGARGTVFFDDVTVTVGNPCRADVNGSGTVTVQDIFDFLALYFSNDSRADINGSGSVTVQDIFDFLALYFTGCPA